MYVHCALDDERGNSTLRKLTIDFNHLCALDVERGKSTI